PETNPASQEAPQAEGEGKQDQSTPVSNQTSSTSLLQPRTLKNNQSGYDPIPLGDDEDDEDDVRDELFSSENPVTTIQPRSPRSVPPKENSSEVKVEAKQSRFGQVKGKNLIHGDDPVNYIKFKDANNREIQKPDGVEVTWAEKPSTAQEGLNKTGRIKIAYYLTSESGVAVKQEKFVTISTPVYHATLTQNPFKTTYGGEFVNKNQPRDGRRYINYNGTSHFTLRDLRVYWENSNIRGEKFSDGTRPWSTNYLGKRLEQLEVRYPGDNGRYDHSRDDNGERYERLNGTFIVKPVKPSIQTSLGKVGKNTLTVNNVNSGTTVVAYDMANPRKPREIGRVSVPKDRDYRIKNGIELTLNSGEVLRKDQKIATKVIYEITNTDQRTESDSSDTLTVKESADYYRDAVQYPTTAQKVTYSDTDITNGNFTTAAKTRFKDKIEEINRQNTQLPTSTTYSVGNTDDKERVAVLGFPDGSTIDISHSQVAKPDVPTITPTDTEQQGMPKVTDADREISGTALQNATKVTLKLQTGKGIEIVKEITVNNTKDFDALVPGEGLLKNGVWKYKLADGQYLRQTDATAEPGSSSLPLKATQTVFDAVSDDTSIYVANKRTVEGKTIEGEVGSPDLKKYIDKPQDAVVYKEKGQEKPFPSDFIAKWENTPNFDTVGTFTYKVKFYEKDSNTPADHISEGVDVTFVVKSKAPATLIHTNRDNGETLVNVPQDADEVVFSIPRSDTAVDTITVKKSEGWTATGIQKRDNTWVFPANSVHGNRTVTAVATAGKGDTKSVETPTLITTLAHDVTVNEITKPTKGNPTSQDLLDAVEATNKKSVALKQGENYPETFGTHQIHLIVTYQDDSTEEKVANYTVPDTRD
ncbi:TPA: hypothetical protein V0Q38_002070, partial [Streptococcus pneumoniae]|nr:hypothetical protein [Streptococcus pneumoniae]